MFHTGDSLFDLPYQLRMAKVRLYLLAQWFQVRHSLFLVDWVIRDDDYILLKMAKIKISYKINILPSNMRSCFELSYVLMGWHPGPCWFLIMFLVVLSMFYAIHLIPKVKMRTKNNIKFCSILYVSLYIYYIEINVCFCLSSIQ